MTARTADNVPWLIYENIPHILIDHLRMARDIYKGELNAFCILPDHLHLILCPGERGLSKFMQAFKSNSMKILRKNYDMQAKSFRWQAGFYDRRIRSARQRSAAIGYVQGNAMKHRLVHEVMDWPWTSLHFPSVIDLAELW